MGRRFVVASEFKPNEPMDEAIVKRLTGGDAVSTRGNFAKGNTTWLPELVPVIATNHLSRISGQDEAIWNRIMVIPFTKSFPVGQPDRDENLKDDILRDELPGVLAWAVEGLRMYREEGLVPSEEITLASAAYRSDADNITTWIASATDDGLIKVEEGPGATVGELFEVFSFWAKSEKIAGAPGRQGFKDRLGELGYAYGPIGGGGPRRSVRVMHGIHLGDALSPSVTRR
jgi:putative DNA primase/helicase